MGYATSRRLRPVLETLAVLEHRKTKRETGKESNLDLTLAAGIVTPNISALCHECHSFQPC